jgi:hypothetical protein
MVRFEENVIFFTSSKDSVLQRVSDLTATPLHVQEVIEHLSGPHVAGQSCPEFSALHPSKAMLEDIASSGRSTTNITYTSVQSRSLRFGTISSAVQDI